MDVRRVVQVWVRDPGGPDRVGSGYLLTGSVVLTAAHVLGPLIAGRAEGPLAADDVLVQSHFAGRTVPAARVLRLGGDIAVLVVDRPFRDPLGPSPVRGTVGSSGLVLPAMVIGYPELELQQRPVQGSPVPGQEGLTTGEAYRRDRQLDGEVSAGTGFGDGTLTLHLAPRHFPRPGAGQPGRSVFMGLSGAAVFIGGHLVGVITQDPNPDHPTVVVGQRLDPVTRDLQVPASISGSMPAQACRALFGPATDVSVTAGARAVRDAHLWQARTILENIPGGRLRDRGPELSLMARFCADPAAGYLVWHAYEWSGKSALLATFVAEPPAGTDIVVFFIDRNDPDARTADRYLASVINQLEAYLDGPHEAANVAVPGAAAGRYRDLLARAAAAARESGRRLVLVIDALDEDDAFTPHPDPTTPIAKLLPADTADLHVIVATRPYKNVLTATPNHHPFRTTLPVTLSASPHAADVRDEAARQVEKAATGTDTVAGSILAFRHVAGDDLTLAELAELASHLPGNVPAVTPATIRTRLQTGLHRTLWQRARAIDGTGRVGRTGDEPYGWAHATLPEMVMAELGPTLINTHAEALHRWADEHHRRGWNDDTPHYLETGYPRLLASTGRTAELTAYALDPMRHRWLLSRRGGNDQALHEIKQAAELLARCVPRNIGTLVLLAFERDRLQKRYEKLPIEVPAVWAMLGNIRRAEVLAHSMPNDRQTHALAEVVQTLAGAGNIGEAKRIANTITHEGFRAEALAGVACALVEAGNIGEAQRVVGTIIDGGFRAEAMAQIAQTLAAAGSTGEAERIAVEAERVAGTITEEYDRVEALAGVAQALAVAGNTSEAERIAGEVERIAGAVERIASAMTEDRRAEALTGVAQALAVAGNTGEAERIVGIITDVYRREEALTGVARALAAAGNIGEADRIAGTITDEYRGAEALTGVARALAAAGNIGRAERVAGTITDEYRRAGALAQVAQMLAAAGNPGEAARITGEAERVAGAIVHENLRAEALAGVAQALAAAGNLGEAERIAAEVERIVGTITDVYRREEALAEVARALAAAGNISEAERVAGTITNELPRAGALIGVAQALAVAGHVGEAERVAGTIASTIINERPQAGALAEVSSALVEAGNIGEAERVARTITFGDLRAEALTEVSNALVKAGNIGEAERVARTITVEYRRAEALAGVAHALVAAGNVGKGERIAGEAEQIAGKAEQIAGTITVEYHRAEALAGVARALAVVGNTGDAERVAGIITDDSFGAEALAGVARALAAAGNPREAERIAGTITVEYRRARALAGVARALAVAGNTGEAERIAGTITYENFRAEALTGVARALAGAGNTGEAERIAGTITYENLRAEALAGVVRALGAAGNPGEAERIAGEAERIAGTISDEYYRAEALTQVARALAAAGNLGEAERIACRVLFTDGWTLAIKALLEDQLVKAAANTVNGWLTTKLVTDLLKSERVLPDSLSGAQ